MCLTYTQLKKMFDDANWEQRFRWEVGDFKQSIRYCKIANRLYNAMMNYPKEAQVWCQQKTCSLFWPMAKIGIKGTALITGLRLLNIGIKTANWA